MNDNTLDNVETSQQKLEIAIMRILVLEQFKIFGCVIYNFNIKFVKDMEDITKILNSNIDNLIKKEVINKINKTFITVTYTNNSPELLVYEHCIYELSIPEIMFIILHEILHIISGHNQRAKRYNPIIYNMAADHIINKLLIEDINSKKIDIKCPNGIFIIDELMDKDLTTEEVYEFLSNKLNQKNKSSKEYDQLYPDNLNKLEQIKFKINNNEEITSSDLPEDFEIETENNQKENIEYINDIDFNANVSEIIEQDITENIQSQIRAILENSKIRGTMSGNISEYIKKAIKVKIPWDTILQKALMTKVCPSKDNKTWSYPYKRFRALNILMPGPGTDKKISGAVILKDTSGSITFQMLKRFANVIEQSLTQFDFIWIMGHDTKIKSEKRITVNQSYIELAKQENDDIIYDNKGRGGTSHTDVFNKIETAYLEENIQIGIVIIMTDFDSNITKIWKNYEWTKNIPVIICLPYHEKIPEYIDKNPIIMKDDVL